MTDPLFFDTDCISAFLWVDEQCVLSTLYPTRIRIPRQTYEELCVPTIPHLKSRIDHLISTEQALIVDIPSDSEAYSLYYQMTVSPKNGHIIIGKGEAACLALAKTQNGIIASNNLRDINRYVKELNINHITTGDIMIEAYQKGIIDEEQGNIIWDNMLKRRRKLGYNSFSECLKQMQQ